MKLTLVAAALLLQMAAGSGPSAEPRHLRYERAVAVSENVTNCAVLDAEVLAHAASRSADDLRLFAGDVETPFALTENSPQPAENEEAKVLNLGTRGDAVVFDLAMPSRAYSEVDLDLNAKDFVATAEVTSGETHLGTFTLFDLSKQSLSRSTALALSETTLSTLHVALRFSSPEGKALTLPASVVRGANVPPSREAQTLYTTVAETSALKQDNNVTVATLNVPAHVPVERVTFLLDPAYKSEFYRAVKIRAGAGEGHEEFDGEIERVDRAAAIGSAPRMHEERLSLDAMVSANLREAADVHVAVSNGNDAPLPIRAVKLEMRQRRICFAATTGKAYMLRYGDEALRAPVYDYARLFDGAVKPQTATLGAERLNASFVARADTRPYSERHPELLWIVLIAVVAVLGVTAVNSMKHKGHAG